MIVTSATKYDMIILYVTKILNAKDFWDYIPIPDYRLDKFWKSC